MSEEKYKKQRKYQRTTYSVTMKINELYKQDYKQIDDVNADIDVFDISQGGLGFYSKYDLPKDFYFKANIELSENRKFKAVLKIVRKEVLEDKYEYGCSFVGLATNIAQMIDEHLINDELIITKEL